jgi:photosystem II stability/assembly factor-like uncharacterized protein
MELRRQHLLSGVLLALTLFALHPLESAAQTLAEEELAAFDWRSIGPTRQSGRFVDIAVDPRDEHTFYMATASGHLWKTVNHGITFEPLFTDEDVFSIGDLALAPSNPDVIYLGTGEANNSRSSYWGNGVYKSTDGGESWTWLGLPESHHIGRVVVHPEDADVVYVAALGHLYSENEERGLYKTTDGGATWEKVLEPMSEGRHIGVVDVVMSPEDPDVLYAASYDKVRLPFTFDLGGPGSRVYKSTDAGATWTMLENGLPGGMLGRIGIDVYHRDAGIVYLTVENANKEGMSDEERRQELLDHESSRGMIGGEVYRSDDAGASWRKVSPDTMSIGGAPAYYYGQIIIDPNDPDVVHVLSAASWGTFDGGETWERRPLDFGGDDHALWIDPDDSDHMILGYDHGMGVTYDGGEEWYHPDFQSLAQFYAVGIDMSRPYRVAGGLQDNGSHMAPHTNPAGGPLYFEQWERVGGGDGMYNEFGCENRYLYNESQFGPIRRLDLWTGESQGIRYDDDEMRWNWNAPILVSPHGCEIVFHAGNKLLRSDNQGESWEEISPDLTKADPATLTTGTGGDGNIQYATITTVDQSPLDADVIWVGTDDGNVQVTRDGGESWTLLNDHIPGNPEYWVSRVEASDHHPGTAFVSQTGYRRDDFRPLVWKTTDYGETWTDISANLPDGPVNVVRQHHENPDLLFVGTEFRVHVSVDGGASWTSMRNDMPVSPVHDLKIHPREDDLIAATHGRGIYIADIGALAQVTPEALAADAWFFEPESRVRWIASDRTNYASSNFEGESRPSGIQLYYRLGSEADEVTLTVHQGEVVIAELEGATEAGIHEVMWAMDRREERSEQEIEQMVERFRSFGREIDPEEVRYQSFPALEGDYTVVLHVDGSEVWQHDVSILKDEWWMERK